MSFSRGVKLIFGYDGEGLLYGTVLPLGKVMAEAAGSGSDRTGRGSQILSEEIMFCEGLIDAKAFSKEGSPTMVGSTEFRFGGGFIAARTSSKEGNVDDIKGG